MKGLTKWHGLALVVIVLFLYYPALGNFYTHDDFFGFRISDAKSLTEFLAFFDPVHAPYGWGFYRPITTQLVYFLVRHLFNFNPLAAHVLALGMFFAVCGLVYKLLVKLTNNVEQSIVGLFLYAASSSHFTHLYSIANQELGHALFYLSAILAFIQFLSTRRVGFYILAFGCFLAALMSKEFAATLPAILVLVYVYLRIQSKVSMPIKAFTISLVPFLALLGLYGYLHIFKYGMIQGESYIWSLSIRTAVNSVVWYGLWAVNLPKLLPDFIGPGLNLNPKLLLFWGQFIKPITILFTTMCVLILAMLVLNLKRLKAKDYLIYIFGFMWFAVLLSPVLFLQWHKFWEYLTLPLIGVVLILSHILATSVTYLKKRKKNITAWVLQLVFLAVFIAQSKLTLELARQTEWTVGGARIARRVYDYFNSHSNLQVTSQSVVFYDLPTDTDLPWKPSEQLKVVLSDNNFFEVFYPGQFTVSYASMEADVTDGNSLRLPARQFLGY